MLTRIQDDMILGSQVQNCQPASDSLTRLKSRDVSASQINHFNNWTAQGQDMMKNKGYSQCRKGMNWCIHLNFQKFLSALVFPFCRAHGEQRAVGEAPPIPKGLVLQHIAICSIGNGRKGNVWWDAEVKVLSLGWSARKFFLKVLKMAQYQISLFSQLLHRLWLNCSMEWRKGNVWWWYPSSGESTAGSLHEESELLPIKIARDVLSQM